MIYIYYHFFLLSLSLDRSSRLLDGAGAAAAGGGDSSGSYMDQEGPRTLPGIHMRNTVSSDELPVNTHVTIPLFISLCLSV